MEVRAGPNVNTVITGCMLKDSGIDYELFFGRPIGNCIGDIGIPIFRGINLRGDRVVHKVQKSRLIETGDVGEYQILDSGWSSLPCG